MPATFAVVLEPDAVTSGPNRGLHLVRLRVTKDRQTVYLTLNTYIKHKDWNPDATLMRANWIRSSYPDHDELNALLDAKLTAGRQLARASPSLSAAELRDHLAGKVAPARADLDMLAFYERELTRYESICRSIKPGARRPGYSPRTAKKRRSTFNKFRQFIATRRPVPEGAPLALPPAELTVALLRDFQTWCQLTCGNKDESIAKDFSILKYWTTLAIDEGLITYEANPFRKVKITFDVAPKARPTPQEFERIAAADLKWGSRRRQARDIWLTQFYLHGARIGDVLELRRQDVTDTHVAYTMRKNGLQKRVKRAPELDGVLGPYLDLPGRPEHFVFPLLRPAHTFTTEAAYLSHIESVTALLNKELRALGTKLEVLATLRSHGARHSFADAAAVALGRNTRLVQELLGHADEKTTKRYLEALLPAEQDELSDAVYRRKS